MTVDAHKSWCTQKSFVSTFIGSTVLEMKDCLQIHLAGVRDAAIIDGSREVPILNRPLWIAPLDLHVLMTPDGTVRFAESRSIDRLLTIIKKDGKPVLSISIDDVSLKVNGYYQMFKNGYISFNHQNPSPIERSNFCTIKVNNAHDVFKVWMLIC